MADAVHKIKGGYSRKRTGNLKATKAQMTYIDALMEATGTEPPEGLADYTRLEAGDFITILEYRRDKPKRSGRYANRNVKYGRQPAEQARQAARIRKLNKPTVGEPCSCGGQPYTDKQFHFLRSLANRSDYTFVVPACKCDASRQIDSLRNKGRTSR